VDTIKYQVLIFSKCYTPMIKDISFGNILLGMMAWNLKAKMIDIETAFLYDDINESNFMDVPRGTI
jgi:hypothetical protein